MRNGSVKSQVTKSQRRTARVIALMCALCLILSGCGTKKESAKGKGSQSVGSGTQSGQSAAGSFWDTKGQLPLGGLDAQGAGGTGGSSVGVNKGGSAVPLFFPADPPTNVSLYDLGLQFAPDSGKFGDFYNYCPSVLQTDASTRYVYYCTNRVGTNVTDYIGCRKGTLGADGNWSYGSEIIVLSPGTKHSEENEWDWRHVCDPSVIAGRFRYGGQTYGYMMGYLGCIEIYDSEGYYNPNSVGIAVANDPMGPWVKCVSLNPIADFGWSPGKTKSWGYGQPSLVSADKAGKVLLFYTVAVGQAYVQVERWDFSGDTPQKEFSKKVLQSGLKNLTGATDYMNNADFGYDEATNRFYAISDCHPHPSDSDPTIIPAKVRITWLPDTNTALPGHVVGDVFRDEPGSCRWELLETIGPELTGKARNHDAGLVRDSYGRLLAGRDLEVMYSVSDEGTSYDWSYLKSYRIHACRIKNAK